MRRALAQYVAPDGTYFTPAFHSLSVYPRRESRPKTNTMIPESVPSRIPIRCTTLSIYLHDENCGVGSFVCCSKPSRHYLKEPSRQAVILLCSSVERWTVKTRIGGRVCR